MTDTFNLCLHNSYIGDPDMEEQQLPAKQQPLVQLKPPAQPPPAFPTVAAVAVKIPPFWAADPQLWYAQVEAQFNTVTSPTNEPGLITWLPPLLQNSPSKSAISYSRPERDAYSTLKDQLIKRMAASEQRRLQQLLNAEELGDRRPTQLLCRMQQLLGDAAGPNLENSLRELSTHHRWINQ